MRKLLLIAVVLYFGNFASAQITLTSSSYPASLLGTDSLRKTVYNSPFPSFAPMSGDLCDMTSIVDTLPYYFAYRVASTSPYDFVDSNLYYFAGFSYLGNTLSNKSFTAIAEFGTEVFSSAYSLTPITGDPYDSLFIPSQMSSFSATHEKIHFPATLGSSWYSGWNSDVNFEISMAAYSLTHTPGVIRRYVLESNSVIGWGKMRLNQPIGPPSNYLDVLQTKSVTQTIDSFFLGGVPMSPIILIALNLTQGKTDTTYAQNFYREQEVTPLANVLFRDAGFTQPYKATTHVQRLSPVGVNDIATEGVAVFPNPVSNRLLNLQLPQPGTLWQYELVSLSGAIVQSGSLVAANNGNTLEVTYIVDPGVYFLRLTDRVEQREYNTQILITN